MKQIKNIILVLAITILALSAHAETAKPGKVPVDKTAKTAAAAVKKKIMETAGEGSTEFVALGRPRALNIVGKGPGPKGRIQCDGKNMDGELNIALVDFDTGIPKRNEHMREKYLETGKYPDAVLKITKLEVPATFPTSASGTTVEGIPFDAVMKLHGAEKAVSGKAKLVKKDNGMDVEAELPLNLADFNISTPKFAGIEVANEVQVKTNFLAKTVAE